MSYKKSIYSKNYQPTDKQPNIENIRYFSYQTKPLSLYGVAIKNIEDSKVYSKMRRDCNKRAKHNCEICGNLFGRDKEYKKQIRIVEAYSYNKETKLAKFDKLLGVCYDCFLALNPYIMDKSVEEHTINSKHATSIVYKRTTLMNLGGYSYEVINPVTIYALEYKGYKYINDYLPSILDRAMSRGVRILPCPFIIPRLQIDYYYHKEN